MNNAQKGFAPILVIIILFLGLAAGLFLVQQQTKTKSHASLDQTRIEIINQSGDSIERTNSRNVKVRLVYIAPSPVPSPIASQEPSPSMLPSSSPSPTPTSSPSPPAGCHYEEVSCFTAPCPQQLICSSPGTVIIDQKVAPGENSGCKTGINSFSVTGSCQNGFRGANFECYGGFQGSIGDANSCESVDVWQQRTDAICQTKSCSPKVKGVSIALAQTTLYPSAFRVANSQAELGNAPEQAFTSATQELDWILTEGNGAKTVYAQFKLNDVWQSPVSASVTLEIPAASSSPTPTPLPSASPVPSSVPVALHCQTFYTRIQASFLKTCGDASYDKAADINKDRIVDVFDVSQLRRNYSDDAWCSTRLDDQIDPCPQPSPTPSSIPSTTLGPNCQRLYDTIRQAYFSTCGDPQFNSRADVNKDRVVNGLDIHDLNQNHTDENWCLVKLNDNTDSCATQTPDNLTTQSVSPNQNNSFFGPIWQGITGIFK